MTQNTKSTILLNASDLEYYVENRKFVIRDNTSMVYRYSSGTGAFVAYCELSWDRILSLDKLRQNYIKERNKITIKIIKDFWYKLCFEEITKCKSFLQDDTKNKIICTYFDNELDEYDYDDQGLTFEEYKNYLYRTKTVELTNKEQENLVNVNKNKLANIAKDFLYKFKKNKDLHLNIKKINFIDDFRCPKTNRNVLDNAIYYDCTEFMKVLFENLLYL